MSEFPGYTTLLFSTVLLVVCPRSDKEKLVTGTECHAKSPSLNIFIRFLKIAFPLCKYYDSKAVYLIEVYR